MLELLSPRLGLVLLDGSVCKGLRRITPFAVDQRRVAAGRKAMQTSDAERTSAWVVVAIGLEPILRSPHPYLSPPMPGASGEYSDRYSARIAGVGLGVDEGREQCESSLHTVSERSVEGVN
jgi:hypothetical protein